MHKIYYATNICLSSGVFPFIILVFSIGYAFCQKLTVAKKTVAAILAQNLIQPTSVQYRHKKSA